MTYSFSFFYFATSLPSTGILEFQNCSFELGYLANVQGKKFKGRLLFDDVSQDCEMDSYEVQVPFNKTGKGYDDVSKCLKARDEDGLQAMIVAKVLEFERELHELPTKGIKGNR